jgi:ABC-type cobalamin/Fe3+-siderophores transport system ATPase subunit
MTSLSADRLVLQRSGATLVDDVSFVLSGAGSVAVIGPNGAGKSSLMKMLAGLETPTAGRVLLADRELSAISNAQRARSIGYLPQHFAPHWDLTVNDLLELGASRAPDLPVEAIGEAIAAFELSGLRRRRWSTLSGGEQARALLAMVLVVDPPVLLADEPAASLDIRHRLDVTRSLAHRGRDRLSIVVVHDLDLAFRFFDRIVLLHRGRIVADAPAAELIEGPLLDEIFAVRFDRLKDADGWRLWAKT